MSAIHLSTGAAFKGTIDKAIVNGMLLAKEESSPKQLAFMIRYPSMSILN